MLKRLAPFYSKSLILYLGGAAFLFGLFIKFASELGEGEVLACDQTVLAWVTAHRWPAMDIAAVDVTALGSKTVLSVLTIVGLSVYAIRKRWGEALYLALGMAAIPLWIYVAKHLYSRPRPPHEMQLIDVSGFSYPSGHSTAATVFYLLLALLMCRRFPTTRVRGFLFGVALLVIGMICFSRIYLGVHYPSDVLSGFFLGSAWVLFLTAFISRTQHRVPDMH